MITHDFTQDEYFEFGRARIGPLLDYFCLQLHAALSCHAGKNVFFCTRAGIRIALSLKKWLLKTNTSPAYSINILPTSRFASLRACIDDSEEGISFIQEALINTSQSHGPIAFSRFFGISTDQLPSDSEYKSFVDIYRLLKNSSELLPAINLLMESKECLRETLTRNSPDKDIVIVDSGWAGTTQLFLEKAFSDCRFFGLYLATSRRNSILNRQAGHCLGLLYNFEPQVKGGLSAQLLAHRHFFESLFEPNSRSVQLYSHDLFGELNSISLDSLDHYSTWDHIYLGGNDYIEDSSPSISNIHSRYNSELIYICEQFKCPSSIFEAYALGGKARSHDVGREGFVPAFDLSQIQKSPQQAASCFHLWPNGSNYLINHVLRSNSGKPTNASYKVLCDHLTDPLKMQRPSIQPVVSVITRTKNRPILLRRAISSVASQTYPYIEHIIVNDGGNSLSVENELLASNTISSNTKIINHGKSVGMEGASNAGISHSTGKYIVIHDDDDSLHPSFIEKCVEYLESHDYCEGVITRSIYVSEEISGQSVKLLSQSPYNSWVEYIMLSEMAINNIFPPISFMFSRDIYDRIGGFNEALPVLGDWEFNLKFLSFSDIGVIPEDLAFYHHRDSANSSIEYSNSVIGGIEKHKTYRPVMINSLLRTQDSRYAGLRSCIASAYSHQELRELTRK